MAAAGTVKELFRHSSPKRQENTEDINDSMRQCEWLLYHVPP